MNAKLINAYLEQAREIVGDRSPGEIAYDDSVVTYLSQGIGIKRAILAANQDHPAEALQAGPQDWDALASHYDYLLEHQKILKKLGMKQ